MGQLSLVGIIAGCEIAFWVVLLLGLGVRYLLKMRRTSAVILFLVPVTDLALLVAMSVDLYRGAQATELHGLGAAYLGFSVGFGHSVISWMDKKFAHRFAGAPKPPKRPEWGDPERTRLEWVDWRRCVVAWAVAAAAMLVMMFVISTPEATRAMWVTWGLRLTGLVVLWYFFGPVLAKSYEKRPPRSRRTKVAASERG